MPLLDEVIEAHGGEDAWSRAGRIRLRARSGGLLLRTRAPGNRFADVRIEAAIGERRATARPFPAPGRVGIYEGGGVRIESDAGEVLESRSDPRALFFGRPGLRRNFRWDALDLVYFAGYAWWNYLNHPWLLTAPGCMVAEGEWRRHGAAGWRRLDVTFPPGIDTHSRHQSFYYDDDLRLRRHDYVAEVVGRWARAAHLCDRHRRVGGLLLATRRRVHPIGPGGRPLPAPTLVSLDLDEIEVVPRDGTAAPPG